MWLGPGADDARSWRRCGCKRGAHDAVGAPVNDDAGGEPGRGRDAVGDADGAELVAAGTADGGGGGVGGGGSPKGEHVATSKFPVATSA
jgi:hypothetical protein